MLAFNIDVNLFVRVDRRDLLVLVAVTAAAYDVCLLLLEDDV